MNKHINVSIAEAKNRLSKIINEVVFAKKRVILNSHGQPKAAMISFDELKKFEEICQKYEVGLCYIFGSQKEIGMALLNGGHVEMKDAESDIDLAVLFEAPPLNSLEIYARLSVDLQDL